MNIFQLNEILIPYPDKNINISTCDKLKLSEDVIRKIHKVGKLIKIKDDFFVNELNLLISIFLLRKFVKYGVSCYKNYFFEIIIKFIAFKICECTIQTSM